MKDSSCYLHYMSLKNNSGHLRCLQGRFLLLFWRSLACGLRNNPKNDWKTIQLKGKWVKNWHWNMYWFKMSNYIYWKFLNSLEWSVREEIQDILFCPIKCGKFVGEKTTWTNPMIDPPETSQPGHSVWCSLLSRTRRYNKVTEGDGMRPCDFNCTQ